jgi:hypothetical protein
MLESDEGVHRSLEFRFLIDRALAANQSHQIDLADAYARAAEGIVKAHFPHLATDIATAASRKGQGAEIGVRLAQHLDPSSAGCVALVLLLRGARKPVINTLASAFRHDPEFDATVKMLCGRVFEPASTIAPPELTHVPIEVASAYRL